MMSWSDNDTFRILVTGGNLPPGVEAHSPRALRDQRFWCHPGRFQTAEIHVPHRRAFPRPFATLAAARYLTRGQCRLIPPRGAAESVTWLTIAGLAWKTWCDLLDRGNLRRKALQIITSMDPALTPKPKNLRNTSAIYLRNDPLPQPSFGGSVTHVAGVIQGLTACGLQIVPVSPHPLALQQGSNTIEYAIDGRHWENPEYGRLAVGLADPISLTDQLGRIQPAFIYQRNTAFDLLGLRLARHYGTPFILEYNGPETWMARHWGGRPLQLEALARRIEETNIRTADIVVAVSEASRSELLSRGVTPERVLIIPNGVDTDRFRPDISGARLRQKFGLGTDTVIGFSGSFGPWHGTDILVEAFMRLCRSWKAGTALPKLLLIGDGPGLAPALESLRMAGLAENVLRAGAVSSKEMPEYLAACDILVSPQLPNTDGSRFFGSPTKFFEYLAMGRAVVASDLEQMGVLMRRHGVGIGVPSGDAVALAAVLEQLSTDPAHRSALGQIAAGWAIEHCSWTARMHTLVSALERAC
jgi:glycosyltransferase involved in cell wall biosynthesis